VSAGFLAEAEPRSRAELDFDGDRPFELSRSAYQPDDKCVYIYSTAVDGFNKLRIAKVQIANVTGINDAQVEFLVNKLADAMVEQFA